MIRFLTPEWWLLVPVLLVFAFTWRRLRFWQPLRLLAAALLVLALMQPQVRRLGRGLDLWVLVDRSASAADGMEDYVKGLEKKLVTGSGHWTQQEEPEQTNAILLEWMDAKFLKA